MKSNNDLQQLKISEKILSIIFLGASLVSLAFWPNFYDPFNPLKFAVIVIISSWLFGILLMWKKSLLQEKQHRVFIYILFCFIFMLGIASLLTDEKFTAFFGDNQRNNGFLMYMGLIVIAAAALNIKYENSKRLFQTSSLLGLILASYGILQFNDLDFVSWNNPYNPVIATLGNPNFAAALMAILATLSFGSVINKSYSKIYRVNNFLITLIILFAIYLSNASQGVLAVAVGIGFSSLVLVYTKNRKFGVTCIVLAFTTGCLTLLGMFKVGPFTSLVYKDSISVRGYYFRAAFEMFEAHPWMGVGVDRYGAYFKQYREVGYPLKYGFDITSSNAHNVPLQFFATGGVFVGTLYLVLLFYIFWRGLVGIKSQKGSERVVITSALSAWLSYQSTSLVSIESPGVAVWGWLLGGVVVGLSKTEGISVGNIPNVGSFTKQISNSAIQIIVSSVLSFTSIILFFVIFQNESAMFKSKFIPDNSKDPVYLKIVYNNATDRPLMSPLYKVISASRLGDATLFSEAISVLEKIEKNDNRNIDALELLSSYYYQSGKINLAIKNREKISVLDPWDAHNYYLLGLLYKESGITVKKQVMLEKILSFAADTEIGKEAQVELTR